MDENASLNLIVKRVAPKNRARPTEHEQAVLDRFREFWPEPRMQELLGDFLRRPGCGSCIDDLVRGMAKDMRKVAVLADQIDPTGESFKLPSGPAAHIRSHKVHRGKIREIDDTEEAWRELLDEMYLQSSTFKVTIRGLEDSRIRVYFY